MTSDEVKTALAKAVKRAWPGAAKASDLPFPEYWKGMTEWLVFHASHVGDELMGRLVRGVVEIAVEAERKGETPVANVVREETRAIWAGKGRGDESPRTGQEGSYASTVAVAAAGLM